MEGIAFCSPVQRGSCREATEGVFTSNNPPSGANTPSALRAPPPRGGGGKWRALFASLFALLSTPALAIGRTPPPGSDKPFVAARMDQPSLSARSIVERATQAAGGETWRRPRTLYLEGYGTFYAPDGTPLINESHRMWRVYPDFKPDAHNADGKVRIESIRNGQTVSYSAFDGSRTYGMNGALPPSAADTQWAENFGFGVIRFALDDGYTLARQPDDLVDGIPVYRIEVTGNNGSKTTFGIAYRTFQILSVGFATPRGWHERIYSEFFTKRGANWVQPGRVRLYYNGVKQNEIVWRDFKVNEPIADSLFGPR